MTSEDLVVDVFDALIVLGVPFMVSGSLASAGRRKDFEDARNVLAVQTATLDREYLNRWCRDLNLLDELEGIERPLER